MVDLAARGAAVLVLSQDLDELYEISDRLAVMFHGKLSAPRVTRRADRGEIGLLRAGVGLKAPEDAHADRA
jgi:simple sugar transport system ATP-binding protein